VLLNHVYLTIEPNTYNAIVNSEFIKTTFAGGGERTVTSNTSWTGLYLLGQETYLEFYNPDKNRQNPDKYTQSVGSAGVIWGIEQEGGSAAWFHAAQRTDSAFASTTATILFPRKIGASATWAKLSSAPDSSIPWAYFTRTNYDNQSERPFASWAIEYHRKYLKTANPDCKPEEDGITRRQYLMRQYAPTKLLQNITSVCIALDSVETRRFVRELKAGGYALREGKREIKADAQGFHFRIVHATESRKGIIEIRMKLNRSMPHQVYTFGENSTLMLDAEEAVWTF
jgi:hypothetical protein